MKCFLSIIVVTILITTICDGCALPDKDALGQVSKYLEGSFSTEWQASTIAGVQDKRTHAARIWRSRTNGIWMYVETVYAEWPKRPYYQRILHLQSRGAMVVVEQFVLEKGADTVEAWRHPETLPEITPVPLVGCDLYITRVDETTFKGATRPGSCKEDSAGADFVTKSVDISPTRIVNNRKGYYSNGTLKWSTIPVEENVRDYNNV